MEQAEERRQPSNTDALWRVVVLIPVLLGFALRLRYLLAAEPFVDEPTTLLAAQAIARLGVPILPSGLFYGNDLPFSYLAGGLVLLFGPRLEILRALSLVASVATIALVYLAGRRTFSPWAGLWAALLLALSPEAIVWGGRARSYALLSLLVFLAVGLFYTGLSADRRGLRRLGLLLLALAAFVHPEAALLLPPFVLGAALLKGWRWWLQPGRLAELALTTLGLAARYGLQHVLAQGWIGGLATATGSRPVVELGGDWSARLAGIAPFFLAPHRLPWTVLALLALAVAVWAVAKGKREPGSRTVFFLSLCLWLAPLEMLLFFGSTYQSPRYLTMLLPLFALVAACGLEATFGLGWIVARLGRWRVAAAAFVTVLLVVAYLPGAVSAANTREKGFRSALEYVARHWQPGDRAATVAPAYSQLVLGRSDLFTLGLDYEEFVYRADDGQWLDRWLGSPLVRSAEELDAALEAGGRLWFVADEGRLRKRFDPAFAQTVWQRMELASKTDQVLVFVSVDAPEAATSRSMAATFGEQVALVGYELGLDSQQPADAAWGEVVVEPGQKLPLTLYWQAVAPVTGEYTVFLHLIGPDGQRVAQDDGPPLGGLQPMAHWLPGERLPDRWVLNLPDDLSPGRYRLEVGLYEAESGDRLPITSAAASAVGGEALVLDYVRLLAPDEALPAPAIPLAVDFSGDGDQIRLLGYDLEPLTPHASRLTLYWQASAPVQADYTVFVHLLDAEDQIQGQGDGPPGGGLYPTSHWDPGEIVVDERLLSIPADAPPGPYRLAVGLYLLDSGRRLQTSEGDRVLLAEVQVK